MSGDRWTTGEAYELYMGRWSRLVAARFVEWLATPAGAHWLELGCGTGALTSTILEQGGAATVAACDPSASFVAHAQRAVPSEHVSFVVAGIDSLPERAGGFGVVVSGLVLNFIAEPQQALRALAGRAAAGASVAAYVWDYAGGIEFLDHFWRAAASLDPGAAELDEARRFGQWQAPLLGELFASAGLESVSTTSLEVVTHFQDFDDFWTPFLGRTGPAPAYVAALNPQRRSELESTLRARLPLAADGSLRLRARATAARGLRPRS
jgi:SAM-dependent methyltransferase